MSSRGVAKLELVKVELERADGSVKRWSLGVTDRAGERRSFEDVKREVAALVCPPLASFTLVCTSPSPLFGCGITSSCWDAVEDGAVLRIELDDPVLPRDVEVEARGRPVKVRGGSQGAHDERQGRLLAQQMPFDSPDYISTPTSSSSRTTHHVSSSASVIDTAPSSPHSTTDTFRTATDSPRLPLSPPHSLPGSRRSSVAFDSHGPSMITISSGSSSSSSSRPPSSRSRSTTPAPAARRGITPSDSPSQPHTVEQLFGGLDDIFKTKIEAEHPKATKARSAASRSPREVRSPGVEDGVPAASIPAASSLHLARQASFEDALRVRLAAEPKIRSPSVFKPSLLAGLVSPGLARTGPPPLDRLPLNDPASLLASPAPSSNLESVAELSRPRRPALDVTVSVGARPLRRRPRLESPADAGQVALRLATVDAGPTAVADAGTVGAAALGVDLGILVALID
ncbi:uncharacterized protein RHOBADRAFT_41270 [Rhodotorula graminis WP1]|uniref:Uncharacterized protein n=1 Tax=Rhodotorula graminis (strain WP1) TaxID=578459 RepID=A0A194S9K3_RHOGW|nr:uncharacterized protein RHOBADRAFT_41270 [Rhodotorula graminis WP1]KPV77277.1 hypothetical protein RHOBADRAFT_41270 [Rhodotorula graminis WP1]